MPQMGVSVAEGTVVEWKKQVGDWVTADEIIAAISTDKIDTDVESPATGRVAEIVVPVGETVDVGTVMARIATDAKPGEAHMSENGQAEGGDKRREADAETGTGEATAALEAPGEAGELRGDDDRSRRYSPVVMRIAAEHNIDLAKVEGSGRGGRGGGGAAGGGGASRTCSPTSMRRKSRRCTSRARTGPMSPLRRRSASPGS